MEIIQVVNVVFVAAVTCHRVEHGQQRYWFVIKWKSLMIVVDPPCPFNGTVPSMLSKSMIAYRIGSKQMPTHSLDKCQLHATAGSTNLHDYIEPEDVDILLISSYEYLDVAEYFSSQQGFNGTIFASDPTIQYGKLRRNALVCSQTEASVPSKCKLLNLMSSMVPSAFITFLRLIDRCSHQFSSFDDANIRIQTVTINERVKLLHGITLEAIGSGYSVGHCNWLIYDENIRFGLIGQSCTATRRHPALLDRIAIQSCDALLFSHVCASKEAPNDALKKFSSVLTATMSQGGTVVVPIRLNGVLFDLLEITSKILERVNANIPIFLVSSQSKQTLAFVNAFCMWLSEERQRPLYNANWPFNHHNLIESKRLHVVESIVSDLFHETYRSPSVIFADDASLEFGPIVHAIDLIRSSAVSTLLLVEPGCNVQEKLIMFGNLRCTTVEATIDPQLSQPDVEKLLTNSNAQLIFSPIPISVSASYQRCLRISKDSAFTISNTFSTTCTKGLIDEKLAQSLSADSTAIPFTGVLSVKDYEYHIHTDNSAEEVMKSCFSENRPTLTALVAAFQWAGHFDLEISEKCGVVQIYCQNLGVKVILEEEQTNIEITDDENESASVDEWSDNSSSIMATVDAILHFASSFS